jgi:hypothetical protein
VAKTRAQLRQRLLDSGFNYLTDEQVNDFLDEAALEFCLLAEWPWRLQVEALAPAPAELNEKLGAIIAVTDVNGRPVYPRRYEELLDRYDLTTTGDPARFYWVQNGWVMTYPAQAQISVRHHARRVWFQGDRAASGEDDTLLCDLEGEDIVYQLARARCKDFNDDFDEGQAIRAEALRRVGELVDAELVDQVDEPDVIDVSEYY